MGGPGLAGFRLDVREAGAGWGIRNADEDVAPRTLDLPTGELRFAFQRLIAVGTVKFEFVGAHKCWPHKRKSRGKSILNFFHTFCRQIALYLLDERPRSHHEAQPAT